MTHAARLLAKLYDSLLANHVAREGHHAMPIHRRLRSGVPRGIANVIDAHQ